MNTVRQKLACLGVGPGSLNRRLFGFGEGVVPPESPGNGDMWVSVRSQLRAIASTHIHLNIIRVGFDLYSNAERRTHEATIDHTIQRTRAIFGPIGLGVGRVLHWRIDAADADGADVLDSQGEAEDLIADWSVDNDGIDVFVVRNITAGFLGIAPSKGDGVIGGTIRTRGTLRSMDGFARTFAHELGHFLSLGHNHGGGSDCPNTTAGCNNLMAQTRCATGCGGGVRVAVNLTQSQGSDMRNQSAVRPGC